MIPKVTCKMETTFVICLTLAISVAFKVGQKVDGKTVERITAVETVSARESQDEDAVTKKLNEELNEGLPEWIDSVTLLNDIEITTGTVYFNYYLAIGKRPYTDQERATRKTTVTGLMCASPTMKTVMDDGYLTAVSYRNIDTKELIQTIVIGSQTCKRRGALQS